MKKHRVTLVAVAVTVAAVTLVAACAVAQRGGPQGGPGMGQGMQMGQGQDTGQQMEQGMGGPQSAAIAATADAVYVVSGHQIHKFDAQTLTLIGSVDLPRPESSGRRGR